MTAEAFDTFLARVLSAFPAAQVEEDNDGQIIIYTGLRETTEGVQPV